MKWKSLSQDRCPKCSSILEKKPSGYECAFSDGYYADQPCVFFITNEKMKEMKARLRKRTLPPQSVL